MGKTQYPPESENQRKKSKRINAFLGIEIATGECFFEAHPKMKSDTVAQCFHNTAIALQQAGFQKVIYYLDQNPTHKNLMKYYFALLEKVDIQVEFRYIPAYSPKLNIVEFLIHNIRQKKLHHAPHNRNLDEIIIELTQYLHQKHTFTTEQINNILDHIRKSV